MNLQVSADALPGEIRANFQGRAVSLRDLDLAGLQGVLEAYSVGLDPVEVQKLGASARPGPEWTNQGRVLWGTLKLLEDEKRIPCTGDPP